MPLPSPQGVDNRLFQFSTTDEPRKLEFGPSLPLDTPAMLMVLGTSPLAAPSAFVVNKMLMLPIAVRITLADGTEYAALISNDAIFDVLFPVEFPSLRLYLSAHSLRDFDDYFATQHFLVSSSLRNISVACDPRPAKTSAYATQLVQPAPAARQFPV